MSEESKPNNKKERSSELRVPPRNWLLWVLILASLPILILLNKNTHADRVTLTENQLVEYATRNEIVAERPGDSIVA